jgi:hypothetical protein
VLIVEKSGVYRKNEPITMGIPFPKGVLKSTSHLTLLDPTTGDLPIQTQVLSSWPDRSLKWVLLDFQITIQANSTKELKIKQGESANTKNVENNILIEENQGRILINTQSATFLVNTKLFKPFDSVLIHGCEILDGTESGVLLEDKSGTKFEPHIDKVYFETKGPLRTTLKVEGKLRASGKVSFASFFSRISFFGNSSMVKMEFTLLNPKAAKHPGGLWDLGDPASIYFKDLSVQTALNSKENLDIQWKTQPNHPLIPIKTNNIIMYQDSSGGENWKSRNHVNRNNKVKNTIRGYRVYSDDNVIKQGLRANPVLSIKDGDKQISGALQYFWQNSPKCLYAKSNKLAFGLFPDKYDDLFELQGGEQKTHTFFLEFSLNSQKKSGLDWIQTPLIPRVPPQWYADSQVFDYLLIPEIDNPINMPMELINTAIKGDDSFFQRREIIDEYGWRNFGELYADHEAVETKGRDKLISHYNNQYDCIYGALVQYVSSGNPDWFLLGDQLCSHVRDIDIYHTDKDRPEYNRGLFWHTEHYIDVQTATHRCFSKKHAKQRNLKFYGGGPALSHLYSKGLLYHYYLTGSFASKDAFEELTSFVENNLEMESTLSKKIITIARKTINYFKHIPAKRNVVDMSIIYSLDGPGRASGNALSNLLDAYIMTGKKTYLKQSEQLITKCVSPNDDIEQRDLRDIENRWMYTIFLQALGRYLDVKLGKEGFDSSFEYARLCLMHYSGWMVENEQPYLTTPEKLEYPNETWATQDIRKSNVLLYASKYSESGSSQYYIEKADQIYNDAINHLLEFDTKSLTRPIALLMQNAMMFNCFKKNRMDLNRSQFVYCSTGDTNVLKKTNWKKYCSWMSSFSLIKEFQYIRWRIY